MHTVCSNGRLQISLWHGTSTLFVEGIREHGLGGRNAIDEWRVLTLAQDLLPLADATLLQNTYYQIHRDAFKRMVRQESGVMNWQHGQAYLTPSQFTATRYAVNKRYGSELLTYTLEILSEVGRAVGGDALAAMCRQHRDVFDLLSLSPAPVLIEARDVSVDSLLSERGALPEDTIRKLESCENDEMFALVGQQLNFRAITAIPSHLLTYRLVNVLKADVAFPVVKYYDLEVR